MSKHIFTLHSDFKPAGDQPKAIETLTAGLKNGLRHQTLLGVTGSGKTFTVANVIANIGKPTLVIAHNKTLAAQLAQEYKEFFPENAVHYFVSYYDYYQPEAYMPVTDTYIEKEAMINDEIDRLRHASTQALLTRPDVIIVASVSCIYGLGSPVEYEKVNMKIAVGHAISRADFIRRLINIHYERTTADLEPGLFRALGNMIEIMPVAEKIIYRINIAEGNIESITLIEAINRKVVKEINSFFLFPAKHFISDTDQVKKAMVSIKAELEDQLKVLAKEGKNLEAERLKRRTTYDLAMIRETGYCNGIENYSRHFSGKAPGEPPDSLLSYFLSTRRSFGKGGQEIIEPDFLTVIDESHVTVPQIGAMYGGDSSRKQSLVDFGFRLPSARDNRPLTFAEFEKRVGQTLYTSATPGQYEREQSGSAIVQQVIRPTGLTDPEIEVRGVISGPGYKGQIGDFIQEVLKEIRPVSDNKKGHLREPAGGLRHAEGSLRRTEGGRVIATTLTKKMAEDLSTYLKEKGIKAEYLHSDIKTIQRIEILTEFRRGTFDCLVGVNLLREGLDLPEVTLIGILDADKEGFLRSETSLIQIIGRAARNVEGRVILYADSVTGSMERAMGETNRRRAIQVAHNKTHNITPKTIIKRIKDITEELQSKHDKTLHTMLELDRKISGKNLDKLIRQKEHQMNAAVKILDFESAALLRDEIKVLSEQTQLKSNL